MRDVRGVRVRIRLQALVYALCMRHVLSVGHIHMPMSDSDSLGRVIYGGSSGMTESGILIWHKGRETLRCRLQAEILLGVAGAARDGNHRKPNVCLAHIDCTCPE